MNFFRIFRIVGLLSEWMEKAMIDGVIDENEMLDLVKRVLDISGVKAEIKVGQRLGIEKPGPVNV